jgi:hypothetical protein
VEQFQSICIRSTYKKKLRICNRLRIASFVFSNHHALHNVSKCSVVELVQNVHLHNPIHDPTSKVNLLELVQTSRRDDCTVPLVKSNLCRSGTRCTGFWLVKVRSCWKIIFPQQLTFVRFKQWRFYTIYRNLTLLVGLRNFFYDIHVLVLLKDFFTAKKGKTQTRSRNLCLVKEWHPLCAMMLFLTVLNRFKILGV